MRKLLAFSLLLSFVQAAPALAVAPATPTDITITSGSVAGTATDKAQINISWTAVADAISYTVSITPDGGVTTSRAVVAPATSATFTDLTGGTTYSFTVSAKNDLGEDSPASSPQTFVAKSIPSVPTVGTAVAAVGQVTLTWTAPTNTGGLALDAYEITDLSGAINTTALSTDTTTVIPNLTAGAQYTFSIKATNSLGKTASQNFQVVTVPKAPGAPTSVTASVDGTTITANWVAPVDDGGSAIKEYKVYLINSSSGADVGSPTTTAQTTATISNVASGSYRIKVVAVNLVLLESLRSDPSSVLSVNTLSANDPTFTPATFSDLGVGATLNVSATAPSGGVVTISVVGTDCEYAAGVLTGKKVGTCTIRAAIDATQGFSSGLTEKTFNIIKGTPVLTWGNVTKTLLDTSPYTVSPPTVSGSLAGTFTYSSSDTNVISIIDNSFTIVGTGTVTITATFTPTDTTNYNSPITKTNTVTISKANQSALTISTTSGTYGSTLTLATTGGSGDGAVTYVVDSGNCSVLGDQLSNTSAGTCSVTATKAANTNYNAVSSSATTITIAKISQSALTISTTSGTYGSTLTLATSGGSGDGAVSYVVNSGNCSVLGAVLSNTSAGSCSVTATKAASTNYNSVSSSATIITIAKISQSALSISTNSGTYGSTLTLATSGGSGDGAVSYVVNSGNCSVLGAVLSNTSAGTCSVTATKAANTNYNAVSSSATTITIAKLTPSLTWSNFNKTVGDAAYTVVPPTVTGGIAGTFTYSSSNTGVITIVGATFTVVAAGTSTITATFTPTNTTNYNNASSVSLITVASATVAGGGGGGGAAPAASTSPTPTPSASASPSATAAPSPSASRSSTPTPTPSSSTSPTPSPSASRSATPTPTASSTPKPESTTPASTPTFTPGAPIVEAKKPLTTNTSVVLPTASTANAPIVTKAPVSIAAIVKNTNIVLPKNVFDAKPVTPVSNVILGGISTTKKDNLPFATVKGNSTKKIEVQVAEDVPTMLSLDKLRPNANAKITITGANGKTVVVGQFKINANGELDLPPLTITEKNKSIQLKITVGSVTKTITIRS